MASSTRDPDTEHEDEIRMWREDGGWVITDVETGVTTQGETREEALEMLDEAVHSGGTVEQIWERVRTYQRTVYGIFQGQEYWIRHWRKQNKPFFRVNRSEKGS